LRGELWNDFLEYTSKMSNLNYFLPMKAFINCLVILLLSFTLTSCEAIGSIFKTGVWTGVILVVAVIAIIIWALSKAFGGGRS
jgi:cytosine/uracil/thiamine/allantoin permease